MSLLSATQVAAKLGITVKTLTTWYKWYNDNMLKHFIRNEQPIDCPILPPYTQTKLNSPRYWDESNMEQLIKFKNWVPKGRGGVMGNVNAKSWGERGRRAIRNKQLKKK